MKIPYNGHQLLQARKNGMKPQGVVLVTDTKAPHADCQLVLIPGNRYDFSMLRGLDVFMAMEEDHLRWNIKPYRKWYDSIISDLLKVSKTLHVIPWEDYAPNS